MSTDSESKVTHFVSKLDNRTFIGVTLDSGHHLQFSISEPLDEQVRIVADLIDKDERGGNEFLHMKLDVPTMLQHCKHARPKQERKKRNG